MDPKIDTMLLKKYQEGTQKEKDLEDKLADLMRQLKQGPRQSAPKTHGDILSPKPRHSM